MIGNRLKTLRESKGLSQRDLAKIIQVSASTVAMYELDQRSPDNNTMIKLADFFDVSTDYLLGRSDAALPDNTLRLVAKEWPETISILYRKGKPTPERDKRAAKIMEVAIPAEDIEDD